MKTSAKIWSIALSIVMGASMLSLAACSPTPEPEHEHTYATTWSSDNYEHWHAATCEHTDEKADVADHDTKGANESCSVCGRAHEHTYAEEWSYNTANHWHDASCVHSDLISGKAKHTLDAKGACTVCDYSPHAHTYNTTEWTNNEVYHWRAATCDHTATAVSEQAKHSFNADWKCTVCGFEHEHTYEESYYAVNETKHWRQPKCEHQDLITEEANHEFGENGRCTTCNYTPLGTNNHTHTYSWIPYLQSHYAKINCTDKSNCKSCDKGYNFGAPKYKNIAPHTYGEDGKCTVCKFANKWSYSDDCIKCEECDGCIKTNCAHEGEATHKKCGDRGTGTKTFTLEAENGEVYKSNGSEGSILDYTNGVRECIEVSYSNVRFTIESTKECYVTLKLRMGRQGSNALLSTLLTAFINDEEASSKAIMAQPTCDDNKCSFDWITFGCIKLEEGTNVIELCQLNGGSMFHLDKIEILTEADVELTWTDIDNTRLYSNEGNWKPLPQDEE